MQTNKTRQCTAGVRKCRLHQSASDGLVNWHVHFWIHTPSVQGTRDLSDCVHSQWHLYGAQGPGAAQNCTAAVRKCCLCHSAYTYCTRNYGILHFLYNSLWVLYDSLFVFYRNLSESPVQVRSAIVQKCHLRQNDCNGLVNWHVHFGNCTSTVRRTTGPLSFCTTACKSCATTKVMVLYRSLQLQYENAISAILLVTSMAWWTGMCISETVYLLYEALWDLPVSAQQPLGLVWQPVCLLPPPKWKSCTGPYSRCTKMPFAPERLCGPSELPCAFWKPYTYCTMRYGTSLFLCNSLWVLYSHQS